MTTLSSDSTYGDTFSAEYDRTFADFEPPAPQIDYLAELAGHAPALEVGVGTGRVAIPLARRGVNVIGLDPSQAMLDALRSKDPEGLVGTFCETIDRTVDRGEQVGLIYAPFNVLFLLDQKVAQRRFFHDAAALLVGGGHVVVECFVPTRETRLVDGPNPAFFPATKHVEVRSIGHDYVTLLVSENNHSAQVWQLNEVTLRHGQQVHIVPSTIAYLTCQQIDDLAEAAGFKRVSRTSDWNGSAFNEHSRKHISTYAFDKKEI